MEVEIKLTGADRLQQLLDKQNRLIAALSENTRAIEGEMGGIRLNKGKQPPAATDGCLEISGGMSK